ncbi:hypothetical protein KM295_04495 [Natronomonas sp. F2-12]|jgi:hypothetical protein|uniref:Uncharacterized protein n=1 Tax=Natronomonas aquatica TaxID=2841590 RepID=A0A9R1CS12_9EURY|nr:hypothetical protein [Natronomonas aquatica]MCQ4332763.1 hypothetical protein [Natronomonas aquatica]
MATGSATDEGPTGDRRLPSARRVGRGLLSALVSAPGRSTATLLVAVPYVWLGYYMVGVALGRHGDVIVSGDWLTVLFTTYALLSALALAHRILEVGLGGLTVESLLDVVVLVWLTAFYFVWMLAREPVSSTTTVTELYAPVLAGEPQAVLWAGTAAAVTVLSAGIVLFPRPGSRPFRTRFRTALVTFPVVITAVVLLVRPAVDSLWWPFVVGVFLGTLVGGAARVHVIAGAIARGLFAGLSLFVWAVGAIGWLLTYRTRPPTEAVVLADTAWGQDERQADADQGDRE